MLVTDEQVGCGKLFISDIGDIGMFSFPSEGVGNYFGDEYLYYPL